MYVNPYVFFAVFTVITIVLLCLVVWHASALDDLDDLANRNIDLACANVDLQTELDELKAELATANQLLDYSVFTNVPTQRNAELYCIGSSRRVPDRPQDVDPLEAYADFGIVYSD